MLLDAIPTDPPRRVVQHVSADNQMKLPVRMRLVQMFERSNGETRTAEIFFDGRHRRVRHGNEREASHFHSMRKWSQFLFEGMRKNGNDEHGVEIHRSERIRDAEHMAAMRRIEAPAEQSDSHDVGSYP